MATVAEIFETMEYGPAPESSKEALAWLGKHERVFGHYIGGAWTDVITIPIIVSVRMSCAMATPVRPR